MIHFSLRIDRSCILVTALILACTSMAEVVLKQGCVWVDDVVGVGDVRFKFSGGKASPVSCTFTENVGAVAYTDADLKATVSNGGDRVRWDFVYTVSANARADGVMLDLRLEKGVKKKGVEKHGTWRRCAANPEQGEAYETYNVKLKQMSGARGTLWYELTGNENWCGPHSEHLNFTGGTNGVWRAGLTFYRAAADDPGWQVAARHAGQGVAVHLDTEKRNNLWEKGPVSMMLNVANTGREAADIPVGVDVRDWDGQLVFSQTNTCALMPGERQGLPMTVPVTARGLYFAEARAGTNAFTRTNFAILPPYTFVHRESSILGMNARFGKKFSSPEEVAAELKLMQRMGVRHLRSGDNRVSRSYGIIAGDHFQCPKTPCDMNNVEHRTRVAKWVANTIAKGAPTLEFGNEIGYRGDLAIQHRLYDAYSTWLDALRAERTRQGGTFKIIYGTSAFRPALAKLIKDKGIFDRLDGIAIHPARGFFTADDAAGGWKYLGLVRGSKKMYASFGYADKPMYYTEVYAKTKPNDGWADSYRQAGENTFLTCALAVAEGAAAMHFYQLHEGISYDEDGVNPNDMEYHYGLLMRDDSPKPSFMGFVTAAEVLDGARFGRWIQPEEKADKLRGMTFDSPNGPFAILYDRTEGTETRWHAPVRRVKGAPFFHYEPWFNHWRVVKKHTFRATKDVVTVTDVLGRTQTFAASNGEITLELTGAPVVVHGIDVSTK
ncbi:MAG TPA: hypothetical protein PLJ32_05680 [Kiritimatiellia bacterium]|nr:hypothetical protein [Kiritimatiellia bacterium]